MALSGTINKDFGGGYRIQIEWTATQNISANTSTITAKFYLISLGSWYINSKVKKTVRIKIDGTTYTSADQTAQLEPNQKKLMATATKTITHNADGTRSFYIGGSIDIEVTLGGTWYGTVTIPDTQFTLNTIPRKSTISLNKSSVDYGGQVIITVGRASASFTHTLRYNWDGQTGTIATGVGTSYTWTVPTSLIQGLNNATRTTGTIYCDTYNGDTLIGTTSATLQTTIPASSVSLSAGTIEYGNSVTINISRVHSKLTHTIRYNWNGHAGTIATGVGTSHAWTVPTSFMNYIPNSTSTTGTIYVDTYNGTALAGTKSVSLTTTVPSSVVPDFSSISHSEANSAVATLGLGSGVYAQNLSKISISIVGATGAYGSTIKSYKITYDGANYNAQSATTNTITNSGTRTISATVTDSRGRTKTKTVNVTVLAYSSPTITSFTVKRCNSDGTDNDMGTYIKVTYGGSFSTLNSKNTATLYIETKPKTSSTWTTKESFSVGSSFNGTKVYSGYDITSSYDVRLRLVDKFYSITSTKEVSTGIVTMSWGKQGVGIGKVWERGALDVAGDVYIDGLLDAKLLNAKRDSLRHAGFYATIDFNQLQAGDFGLSPGNSTNGPKTGQFLWVMTQALYSSGYHDGGQPSDMIQIILPFRNNNDFYFRNYYNGTWYSWNKIWHEGNDGSGSGLDADMVDGYHLNQDVRTTASPTFAALTINGATGLRVHRGSSGNIILGIGVRTPNRAELHLNANGDNSSEILFGRDNIKDENVRWSISARDGAAGAAPFYIYEGPYNADGWFSRFAIVPGGNVGIGTSTPGEKLHVAGKVKATSFINSSSAENKAEINLLSDSAYEKIKAMKIYEYVRTEEGVEGQKQIGILAEEAPEEILNTDKTGVDLYSYISLIAKAVQETQERLEKIEQNLKGGKIYEQ